VRLCNLSERVVELLKLTRLDTVLELYATEGEALANIRGNHAGEDRPDADAEESGVSPRLRGSPKPCLPGAAECHAGAGTTHANTNDDDAPRFLVLAAAVVLPLRAQEAGILGR